MLTENIEIFLLLAGVLGGAMNALAGGGSALTFAAMLAVGMPPVLANTTSTVVAGASYTSGILGFRGYWPKLTRVLAWQIMGATIGGLVGGWLLLKTDADAFSTAVPWLLLLAFGLLLIGPRIQKALTQKGWQLSAALGGVLIFLLYVYGGYFQGGLGIIAMAVLTLFGYRDIRALNAVKLVLALFCALAASVVFIRAGAVDYRLGLWVLLGLFIGGYGAAYLSTRISPSQARALSLTACAAVTAYAFLREFA